MLYHITEKQNQSSISQHGLLRGNHAFICLCVDVNNWIDMFQDPIVFKIDINRFMEENPNVDIRTWQPDSDEVCVWSDIPTRYII